MKFLLAVILFVCALGLLSAPILADDNQPLVATADKPSDDTIREFHSAVADGNKILVEKMLATYPDLLSAPRPDDDPAKQVTPVFTAIDHGQTEVLSLLLKHGASCNTSTTQQPPLDRATLFGTLDVVKVLLDGGANVDGLTDPANTADLDDPSHGTPLRDAVSCGHLEMARLLVQRGAHVDLYSAAGMGWAGWVGKQIKDHPEQTDLADGWRYTPLCYAVAGGSAGTAEILLSHGADITRTYDDGGTLLHLATFYGYHDLIAVLLAHGADVNAKNKAGETAVDYAIKYKQQDAEQLLRDHGGKCAVDLNN